MPRCSPLTSLPKRTFGSLYRTAARPFLAKKWTSREARISQRRETSEPLVLFGLTLRRPRLALANRARRDAVARLEVQMADDSRRDVHQHLLSTDLEGPNVAA